MKLTKQQAIEGHRKMWNWIADEIERQKRLCDICSLKIQYCNEQKLDLLCDCFCCEYTEDKYDGTCISCPLDWGVTKYCAKNEDSLFLRVLNSKSLQEQIDLARQIANLPERVDIE